jgi:imidazolonepropionase-like amidohydrolase
MVKCEYQILTGYYLSGFLIKLEKEEYMNSKNNNFKNTMIVGVIVLLVAFFVWLPEPKPESETIKEANIEANIEKGKITLIINANLFDGEVWRDNADIAFSEGIILEVSSNLLDKYPNANVIEAKGKVLMPGLIDSHTHAWGYALKKAIQFGVTTELDMFTNNAFAITQRKLRSTQQDTQQADLFSAGTLVTAPDGHGTEYGFEIATIENAKQAESFVKARIEEGADYIKIVYNATSRWMPSIDKATLIAVIQSAQSNGKLAVVHISDFESALHAIEAGADGLVHSFMQKADMTALVKLMSKNNQFVIPTLSVMDSMMGQESNKQLVIDFENQGVDLSTQKEQLSSKIGSAFNSAASEQAKTNVKIFLESGVLILAGTDAPNPGTAHGVSIHGELELLVKSGLNPTQAIKAATSNPAKAFKLNDRGFLMAGKKADILLLNADPRLDITNTRKIDSIYKNGYLIQKLDVALVNNKITKAVMLADFESDLTSGFNTPWLLTTDEMFKGNSSAEFKRVSFSGNTYEGTYINIKGTIGRKFSFPWAGIFLPFTKSNDQGLDISEMKSIAFKTKGKPGKYKLMLFSTNQPMRPIEVLFSVTQQWETIHLPLKQVPQGLLQSISGIALVAGSEHETFELNFDDIWLR